MNTIEASKAYFYNSNNLSIGKTQNSDQQITQPNPQSSSSSEVNISAEGKALAVESPEGLKKMALPSWYGNYIPNVNILNSNLSQQPGTVEREQNYINDHRHELNEYSEIFKSHFEEAKAENGIITQEDMYEKVIKNPDFSETLRLSVEQKLNGHPRAIALMEALGIGKI